MTSAQVVSHQQQFFSELPSPGRTHYTNYKYYNIGYKGWKKIHFIRSPLFCPSPPPRKLTKHFHLTEVCILPFSSNVERENWGTYTYSVGITIIMISCFWHFPTQFVHGFRFVISFYSIGQTAWEYKRLKVSRFLTLYKEEDVANIIINRKFIVIIVI